MKVPKGTKKNLVKFFSMKKGIKYDLDSKKKRLDALQKLVFDLDDFYCTLCEVTEIYRGVPIRVEVTNKPNTATVSSCGNATHRTGHVYRNYRDECYGVILSSYNHKCSGKKENNIGFYFLNFKECLEAARRFVATGKTKFNLKTKEKK